MDSYGVIKPYFPTTFGSAAFLTAREARMLGVSFQIKRKDGKNTLCPYVGVMFDDAILGRSPTELFAHDKGHILTVAPTRTGKGTGQIIPNLVSWKGSAIVIDIKGENYSITSGYRHKRLRQRIIRIAPFEKTTARWNPLMSIRADLNKLDGSMEEQEDVRYLTNLIITPSGSANDVFWENSAKNFLEGLILHVRTARLTDDPITDTANVESKIRERSMREVRRLLTSKEETFQVLLEDMIKSDRTIIRQAGSSMSRQLEGEGKTGTSILAIAEEQTSVWAYDRLYKATYIPPQDEIDVGEPGQNDFEFLDLRDGNTTLYIIIPPDYLSEYRAVLRVFIGIAMRELRNSYSSIHKNSPPVLFILDEFPQLGYMRPIEEAILYMAGYGVLFWFFVQDLSQLQLHYQKSWQTFMANAGTQCFFGVGDTQTANMVSEIAGTSTVMNRGYGFNIGWQESESVSRTTGGTQSSTSGPGLFNTSSGSGTSWSDTTGHSWGSSWGLSSQISYVGRRLITPDEVWRMKEYEQIIFMKGFKPIRCINLPFYWIKELKEELNGLPPPEEISFL